MFFSLVLIGCIAYINGACYWRNVYDEATCKMYDEVYHYRCTDNYMTTYCNKYCCEKGSGGIRTTLPPFVTTTKGTGGGNLNCGNTLYRGGKVIAGRDARKGEFPWQVLLKMNGRPGCGGSLISPNWVVTAAHCIRGSRGYTVVMGEHNRNIAENTEQEISGTAYTHPRWNSRTFDNDIALIKLDQPAKLNSYVQPICLPEAPAPVGSACVISGWGKTSSFGQMHHLLKAAPMKVIDKNMCDRKNFGNIRVHITDQMICGGGDGRISGCQGDSGGPLSCYLNGRWELHGAVSHGSRDCNSYKTYTVFGRVSQFTDWIKRTTNLR